MSLTHQLDTSEIDRLNHQALSCLMSNRSEAKRLTDISLAAAGVIGYRRGMAYAQINQLSLLYYVGELEQAEKIGAPLLKFFHSLGDLEGEMSALVCLGSIASRRSDFVASEKFFEAARQIATQIPDSLYKFSLYNRGGIDAVNRGDTRAGPRDFLLALDMAERFGTAAHRVNSLSNLASSQHDLGNDEDAIPLLGEALDLIRRDNLIRQEALVSANLAMCLLASGKTEDALVLLEPYYSASEMVLSEDRAFILCLAANAFIVLGKYRRAEQLVDEAQKLALESEDYEEQMHSWLVRGMLDFALDDAAKALSAYDQAHALLEHTRNPFYMQLIFRGLADAHARLGNWEFAYGYLQQYQSHFETCSKSARDSRMLMRNLEKEMKSLKDERDRALELHAARETENKKLEDLNKELAHQIRHVNSLQNTLKEQAIRDHLTGLYNRRHFETCLHAVLHEAGEKFQVTVAILDLDFFKLVNDTYGHGFGDEVLIQFARVVESQLRGSDMLCRYGGEEFCLLMREADSQVAVRKIENIAAKYRELVITQGAHTITDRTFSAGIAEFPIHGTTRHELLMRADTALYVAKMAGRNQLRVADITCF